MTIEVRTLGPLSIRMHGEDPPGPLLWRKNIAVLMMLAHATRGTLTREQIIGALWADRTEKSARHSLREALSTLRRHLGAEAVRTTSNQATLDREAVWFDSLDLERLASKAQWSDAAALVAGPFLDGFVVPDAQGFDEWLTAERHRLRELSIKALVHAGQNTLNAADADGALRYAQRAGRLDPLDEQAVNLEMRALCLNGRRSAALERFLALEESLRELGATPSATQVELADRVRSERTWARGENARRELGRDRKLVGRASEITAALEAVQRCVRQRTASVILVTGDPGMGKSRFAEEVAARARLDHGCVHAHVRAVAGDRARANAGLSSLWTSLARDPSVRRADPNALGVMVQAVPVTGDLLPGVRATDAMPVASAFVEVLAAVCEERLCSLTVDDAHHLDEQTLLALEIALRDLADRSLMVLLTTSEVESPDVVEKLRSRVGREVDGVAQVLGPLTEADVRLLVQSEFPDWAEDQRDRLARRVAVDSGRVPLLAVEVLRAVHHGLDLEQLSSDWPRPLRTLDDTLPADLPQAVVGAIRVRFRVLPKTQQHVLRVVAALPEPVAETAIEAAGDVSTSDCRAALDGLEWDRWLAADERGYAYVARIVRDVVGDDLMTPGQRARIVARVDA